MKNSPQKNQLKNTAPKPTYSIDEIIRRYKILNSNLVIALNTFTKIRNNQTINIDDFEAIKELNIRFEKYNITKEEIKAHGKDIYTKLLHSVFEETMELTQKFFCFYDPDYWYPRIDDIEGYILKSGIEISFMLSFFNALCKSLKTIAIQSEFYLQTDMETESGISAMEVLEFYDFDIVTSEAMEINNPEERIAFFIKEMGNKELFSIMHSDNKLVSELCENFTQKSKQAIEVTKRQLNHSAEFNSKNNELTSKTTSGHSNAIETNEIVLTAEETEFAAPEKIKNKDFTTARQVLAIYYLLNEIDHRGINQIDKTVKARFIEFLTGRDYTNIYKAISNPLKGLSNQNSKAAEKDMQYVAEHFQKLGMQSIVEQINRDLKSDE